MPFQSPVSLLIARITLCDCLREFGGLLEGFGMIFGMWKEILVL